MIALDQLGESPVLNLHISYIEDNAYFKFEGIRGVPLFLKFSSFNDPIFRFFFLLLMCVLIAFKCFKFLA